MADPTMVSSITANTLDGGGRIDVDYRAQLVLNRESAAPFTSLMLNINTDSVVTNTFGAFEDRPNPKKGTISGAVAVGGGANIAVTVNLVADHGDRFKKGDIVIGKLAVAADATQTTVGIVTAVSSDALTVKPADPALIFAPLTDGDVLQIWGNSFAGGADASDPLATVPAKLTFYTQIFKDSYQVDKTQANNRLYGAPERDRLRAATEIAHLIEIEKAMLNGLGIQDTTNQTSPRGMIKGVIRQFTSNVLPYGATLTKAKLFHFMTTLHAPKYATDGKMSHRLCIVSADILEAINNIAEAVHQVTTIVTEYGVDITKMIYAGRTWDFVEDPVLSDLLPGYGVVFHPRYVKLREFRPTRLEANIQLPGYDCFKDQFLSELGLEITLEELGGVLKP